MPRRTMLPGVYIILGCLVCFYLITPPFDSTLIRRFQQHPEIKQLTTMFAQDRQPMTIDANGAIFLGDGIQNKLSQARLDAYRALVKQSGARQAMGDIEGGMILYYPTPLFLPGLTVKSLRYSPVSPSPVTSGATDFYHFRPGQYQYVCRALETSWYVCKDNED